jgi:SAM-dependent methyltransferase
MAYYDQIAKQWHQATGYKGGAFKEYVLNDVLLGKLESIQGCSILELGAGNGYFMPLLLHHFSGEVPSAVIISDASEELLKIARKNFSIPGGQYQMLDVRNPFPFENNHFEIILASMVFNEVPPKGFSNALQECRRTMSANGQLLIAVTHPEFIDSLNKRDQLQRTANSSLLTMPGAGSLRLPVIVRPLKVYRDSLAEAGFEFTEEEVYPNEKVLNEKSGLRHAKSVPLAVVFNCSKRRPEAVM